jgi:hypothetical protein
MADEVPPYVPAPDRTEPSDERKAELRAAYQEGSEAPYKDVPIRTLGELYWIFSERNWSGEYGLPEGTARPNLSGADLGGAEINDANLSNADLSGADLTRAFFTSKTNLDGITLGQPPPLVGVRWNGVPLDAVDWTQLPRLGDETAIGTAKTRQERAQAYRTAVRAYHGLVVALETQGLTEPARRFRKRERWLERRALRARPRTWFAYGF